MLGAWEVDIWARKLLHGVEHVEDSENFKKIAIPLFKKNALKVGKTHFRQYFRVAGGLNNGVNGNSSGG